MPTAHACENDERNYLPIFNKAVEGVTDCCSSIESSFDSESHYAKDCTSSDVSQKQIQVSDSPAVGLLTNGIQSESQNGLKERQKHVYIAEEVDEEAVVETSFLRRDSDKSGSVLNSSILSDNYLTMSGTIKRGKKKGQCVDVILNMSREELEVLEATMVSEKPQGLPCRLDGGPHIVLLSLLCAPFCFLASAFYSFGIGTLTWYNIFVYFEDKPLWCRILVSPMLILLYPFVIVVLSLGLGVVAGVWQVSWHWRDWLTNVSDLEKGFYGWLCNALNLPDCSPYEVVILSGIQKPEG